MPPWWNRLTVAALCMLSASGFAQGLEGDWEGLISDTCKLRRRYLWPTLLCSRLPHKSVNDYGAPCVGGLRAGIHPGKSAEDETLPWSSQAVLIVNEE
jgi:hypothetical protein